MAENSKKPKSKILSLLGLIFFTILILSFGILIYKSFDKVKTSKYLDTIRKLSQGENPQEYKLYLTKTLGKIKNKGLKARIYSKLGDVNLSLENYPEAVKAYKNSYNLYSDDPELCTNLGLALGEIGKHGEAIEYLNIAKKLDPKIPQIYNNLGIQFANQKRNSKAIINFKKGIEIDPKFYRAYTNLSAVYFGLKDYENTKKYINLAIENGANSTPALKELLQQQAAELAKKLSETFLE